VIADIRRGLTFFRPYRGKVAFLIALMLAGSVLGLLPALLTGRIIDALTGRSYDNLVRDLLFLIAGGGLATVISLFVASLTSSIEQNVAKDVRLSMLRRLAFAPCQALSEMGTGRIATRVLGDVDGLVSVTKSAIIPVATSLLVVLTALATMLVINWQLTMLSVVVVCVTVPAGGAAGTRLGTLRAAIGTMQDTLNALVIERFSPSGMALMKQATREAGDLNLFSGVISAMTKTAISSTVAATRFQAFVGFATSLGPALVLAVGGWMVTHGDMSVGTLVAFIGLQTRLYGPATLLTSVNVQLATTRTVISRVYEVLDQPFERDGDKTIPSGAAVEFAGVTIFKGDSAVVRDVCFSIESGEFVAVIGASGSGKSTLLRSIIGCEAVLEGCVRVGGVDVACADLAGLRRRVVIVPSDGFLLADSVDGNLRYQQKPLLDEDIRRLASLTGSLRCIEKRPNGFDTFVGFEGRDFSLGERQRIALTRALLQGPEVLVLDEATSGIPLDEEMSLLSEIRRSTTVKTLILVTHRLSSATLADRILVLDDGRLIHSGSPAEILTTAPLVARRGEFAREHAFVETT